MLPLSDRVYDVAIIGGGILGASIARDCAMRRLSAILLEKEDLGAGTTGAAAGVLWGGSPFLDTDRSLTRQLCEEVNVLQRIAPNLVTQVPFLVPIEEGTRKTSATWMEAWTRAYNAFANIKASRPAIRLSRKAVEAVEPRLAKHFIGGLSFDEWVVDPQRLLISTVRSAAAAGTQVVTGARVDRIEIQNREAVGVTAKIGSQQKFVRSRTVVNAAGPWSSQIDPKCTPSLRYQFVQHIYLVFERELSSLGLASALNLDGPWLNIFPRQGRTYAGPWEVPFEQHPDRRHAKPEEIHGLIQRLKHWFPDIHQHRVLEVISGVHCRKAPPPGGEKQKQEFLIDHAVDRVGGLYSVAGGGLVRARRLAEEVTDMVCRRLRQKEPCRTHLEALPGCSPEAPWLEEARRTGRDPITVKRLMDRHGYHAHDILMTAKEDAFLSQTLCECENILAAEVDYCIRKEYSDSLSSLGRRTRLGRGTCQGSRCLSRTCIFLGERLRWSPERIESHFQRTIRRRTPPWGRQLEQEEFARYLLLFTGGHLWNQ